MSMTILLFLLAGDWAGAKAAAEQALKAEDPVARRHAVERLAEHDRRESVDLLLKLHAASTGRIAALMAEVERRSIEAKPAPPQGPSAQDLQRHSQQMLKNLREGKPMPPPPGSTPRKLEELPGEYGRIETERGIQARIVAVLAAMKDPKGRQAILEALSGAKDWPERFAAAKILAALGEADDPVLKALRKSLGSERDPRVLIASIDALVALKDKGAVEVIGGLLSAKDWFVRIAAAEGLAGLGSPEAIPLLVEALRTAEGREVEAFNAALVKLAGVDCRGNPSAWKDWWESHREEILAGTYVPPKAPEGGARGTQVTFYGIPVVSLRVVFVLDVSGSMKDRAGWKPDPGQIPTGEDRKELEGIGDRKIDVALFELRRAVRNLPEETRFNIVLYNEGYKVWREEGLAPASKSNKRDALKFTERIDPDGGTNFFEALERAFHVHDAGEKDPELARMRTGADTIYMLSDGRPTVGRLTHPDNILERVAEMNRERRIAIHTVAVGAEIDRDFMRRLAEEHGGTFVHMNR